MGFLKRLKKKAKKVLDFEDFNLKDMVRKLKDDPKRLLLGVDKGSTAVWNKALGRDDEPIVNEWGGPTEEAYQRAAEAGIDVGPGAAMHAIAQTIAGTIAGGYGLDKLASAPGAWGKLGRMGGGNPAGSGPKLGATEGITDAAGNIIPGTEFTAAAPRQGVLGRVFGVPEGGIRSGADLMNIASTSSGILGAAGPLLTSAGSIEPTAVEEGVPQLPVSLSRERLAMPSDLKGYGKSGGEHRFFGPARFTPVHPSDVTPLVESEVPVSPADLVKMAPRFPSRGGFGGKAMGGRASSPQFVSGGGSGRDDTVEALLSDGEYVFDAESVALLGDGSLDEGAARLDAMRENIRKHKGAALAKGKFTPAAKAPEQYLAKGGRPKLPSRPRVAQKAGHTINFEVDEDERMRELDTLRMMIRAHQRRQFPQSGESIGYDPYNRPAHTDKKKARGGAIDIGTARSRVTKIKALAKEKPVKRAEGGPVGELSRYADRLEAKLKANEPVETMEPERIAIMDRIGQAYAKGGHVDADIIRQVMEKHRPKRPYTPEEVRQMAEDLRRFKPDSEVLRQYDAAQNPTLLQRLRRKVR